MSRDIQTVYTANYDGRHPVKIGTGIADIEQGSTFSDGTVIGIAVVASSQLSYQLALIPEPSSALLLSIGLMALYGLRKRRLG